MGEGGSDARYGQSHPLARLYNASLDELLRTEDEIPMPEQEKDAGIDSAGTRKTCQGIVYSNKWDGSLCGSGANVWLEK